MSYDFQGLPPVLFVVRSDDGVARIDTTKPVSFKTGDERSPSPHVRFLGTFSSGALRFYDYGALDSEADDNCLFADEKQAMARYEELKALEASDE